MRSDQHRSRPALAMSAALLLSMTVAIAGCGSSGSKTSSKATTASTGVVAVSNQTLTVADNDLDTLLPAASELSFNELDELWAPIVAFNSDGSLKYVAAKSVTSSHGDRVWTIAFRPGWTFHNGQPVTASSYSDAWNFTAYKPNAYANASELSEIEGYSAVNPLKGKATAKTMSGLKVLSPYVLQVTLTEPDSQFPEELTSGDLAFYPMPTVGLKDPKSFETDPIGDGPYEMNGAANLNEQVQTKVYAGYKGTMPNNKYLVFKLFSNADTAYTATQAGAVDIDMITPQDKFASIKSDFGSRDLQIPGESIDFLGFPLFKQNFQNIKLREAISEAIDRPAIASALLGGQSSPATGLLAPGLLGGSSASECSYCKYDPTEARALLKQAGGWSGTMVIAYPGGAGYDQEFQAIANEIRENLGITSVRAEPSSGFSAYISALMANKYTQGPFRGHWGSLYPSAENTLASIFEKGSSDNVAAGGYSNPKVTALITAGNAASSQAAAVADYQAAAKIILSDVAVVPLFYPTYPTVYSTNVQSIAATPHEIGVDFDAVTLSK